jgi:hypothetical protein
MVLDSIIIYLLCSENLFQVGLDDSETQNSVPLHSKDSIVQIDF